MSTSLAHPLCGRPLALVAASESAVQRLASGAADEIAILPPLHLSDSDTYLVVPAASDPEPEAEPARLAGELRRARTLSVVVRGELSMRPRVAVLSVAERFRTAELFEQKPFDVVVPVRSRPAPEDHGLLAELDRIPVAPPARGRLFDHCGLERILRSHDLVGPSWRLELPEEDVGGPHVPDPTWCWSRRGSSTVSLHLMVFGDYEERYALINPIQLLLPKRGGSRGIRGLGRAL